MVAGKTTNGSNGRRFGGGLRGQVAFGLTCGAYLATTTGEALLSPIYPTVSVELGFGLSDAGLFFAVLAGSIAVATLAGGLLVHRFRAVGVASLALSATAAGSFVAALAQGRTVFTVSQILIGTGAGLLWPAAVKLIGEFAPVDRRGFAMGIFGAAFSGGLVAAAVLAAMGSSLHWRWAFGISCGLAAAAGAAIAFVRVDSAASNGRLLAGLRPALGLPLLVGVVGGVSQYATVSFLPVFGVEVWSVTPAQAALVLVSARVLSVPIKLAVGALADRTGPEFTARILGLTLAVSGLAWAGGPRLWVAVAGAIGFAALVSGLFPLANVLALDRSGGQGVALGVFRGLQIGAGAVGGLVLGAAADRFGLRPTIAATAVVPFLLVLVSTAATPITRATPIEE